MSDANELLDAQDDDTVSQGKLRQRNRDRHVNKLWTEVLIPAAKKAKAEFQKNADATDEYFSGDHDHIYERLNKIFDPEGHLCLTVNLAFQVRAYMGPHLYHRNPVRTVTATSQDPVLIFLAHVMDLYLNATPNETGLKEAFREMVDDALLPGRGALETHVDPVTRLVTTRHVPIDDVFIDPDAKCPKEALWIAIRRQEPLFVVRDRFGKEATKGLKANAIADSDSSRDGDGGPLLVQDDGVSFTGQTSDLVEYYEVWSKFGSGLRAKREHVQQEFLGMEATEAEHDKGHRYKHLVVAKGFRRPLYEGPWEIPLHLDDDWLIGFCEFTPTRKGSRKNRALWGIVSLMKAGMGHQQAIDLVATLWFHKIVEKAKTIYGAHADKDEIIKSAIADGGLSPVIPLGTDDVPRSLQELIQILDLGEVSSAFLEKVTWHETKFGETTGLLPLLKGGAGTKGGAGETQIRSATEIEIRNENSRSRLEDMNDCVEQAATRSARREALGVRLALGHEEVHKVVGDKIEQRWWKVRLIVSSKEFAIPDLKGTDERPFWPEAATYWQDPEEAKAVAVELNTKGRAVFEERWLRGWRPPGVEDDAPWFMPPVEVVPVDVRELWLDTAGKTAEELAREFWARIEAGSARRPDHQLKIDQAQAAVEHVGRPALERFNDANTYNKALDMLWEALQVPRRNRVYLDVQFIERSLQAQAQAEQQGRQVEMQADQQVQGLKIQGELVKLREQLEAKLQEIQVQAQADTAVQSQIALVKSALDPPGAGGVR